MKRSSKVVLAFGVVSLIAVATVLVLVVLAV